MSSIVGIKYIEELEQIRHKYGIARDDVCILSSASFAVMGLKENGDIEFTIRPSVYNKMVFSDDEVVYRNEFSRNIKFSEFISYTPDMYRMFDIYDLDLFGGNNYVDIYEEYRIIKPEIHMALKYMMNREKDEQHIRLIESNSIWNGCMRNRVCSYVNNAVTKGWPKIVDRKSLWEQIMNSERDIYIFGTGIIAKHVYEWVRRNNDDMKIKAFLEINGSSTELYEKKVMKVCDVENKDRSSVIVAVAYFDILDTIEKIKKYGYDDVVCGFCFYV